MADCDETHRSLEAEVSRKRASKGKSRAHHGQSSNLLVAQLDAELVGQRQTKKARSCTALHKELVSAVKCGEPVRRKQFSEQRKDQGRRYEYESLTGRLAPHTVQKSRSPTKTHHQQQLCASPSCFTSNHDVNLQTECWMESSGTDSRLNGLI